MAKLKLRGKDLIALGYPEGRAIGMAINMMLKHYKRHSKEEALSILKEVLENQEQYEKDAVLGRIVNELRGPEEEKKKEIKLVSKIGEYPTFGRKGIEEGAFRANEYGHAFAHHNCGCFDAGCPPGLWTAYWGRPGGGECGDSLWSRYGYRLPDVSDDLRYEAIHHDWEAGSL